MSAATAPVLAPDLRPLDPYEKCDRCGAPAQARWSRGTQALSLCGHHSRAHRDALSAWADSLRIEIPPA